MFSIFLGEGTEDYNFITGIYRKYYPIMSAKVIKLTDNPDLVNDVINQTFVSLISHVSTLKTLDTPALVKYLVLSIQHETFRQLRLLNKTIPLNDYDLITHQNTDVYTHLENSDILDKLLKNLTDQEKDLLICRYVLDYDYKHISVALQIPLNQVGTRLQRTLKKVRRNNP